MKARSWHEICESLLQALKITDRREYDSDDDVDDDICKYQLSESFIAMSDPWFSNCKIANILADFHLECVREIQFDNAIKSIITRYLNDSIAVVSSDDFFCEDIYHVRIKREVTVFELEEKVSAFE